MSTNEPRASELCQRVPDAFRLAFLLVFKPLELWASMVLWDVDGDPGLRFIWPLRGRHQRDWVFRLSEISGAAVLFACLVLWGEYKSDMLGLIAIGLLVAIVVAWVAGIAFATLLGVLVAGMMMVGVWLPSKIADVPATVALWCFGIGFAIRISWVISDQVFFDSESEHINEALFSGRGHRYHKTLRPYVSACCAFACYLAGDTGVQQIAFVGLLGLGISLHPLVERIRQVVQRRKPLVFLSYRRSDDASHVLVKKLQQILPQGSTFLDERMPSGEWQRNLLSALERATVLLTFVGPKWKEKAEEEQKKEQNYTAQRRASFWVSFELGYVSRRKIPIRPIMVDHDDCPMHLRDFQWIQVSSEPEKEEEALEKLIDVLKRDGMRL